MYRLLYRTLLARIDSERIHDLTLGALSATGNFVPTRPALNAAFALPDTTGMAIQALGLTFPHPLGLAAGFDKDGRCLNGIAGLGFSFAEIGTVTPRPQPGNPRPRMFRLMEDRALINRMGFPSAGMNTVARNLRTSRPVGYPVGISLGKNKETPLTDADQDYGAVLKSLYSYGDFFVVNISSPNTPDLRKLQTREYLENLLASVTSTLESLSAQGRKPLLIKLSPDLMWPEIDLILDLAVRYGIAGIVATNTTTSRDALQSATRSESGGLSGQPVRQRSTDVIRYCYQHTGGKMVIIGVGGVFSGDDVWAKLQAGASLVQTYTGLVYQGPYIIGNVVKRLRQIMRDKGIKHLQDVIGSGNY